MTNIFNKKKLFNYYLLFIIILIFSSNKVIITMKELLIKIVKSNKNYNLLFVYNSDLMKLSMQ